MKINGITFGVLSMCVGFWLSCAGYHIGPTNGLTAGAHSVQIQFFENETFEPRLAEITVINSATGEEIFKETLTGTSTVRVGNDLTAGQRQAVPIIAAKLAEQAVLRIVDGNWPDPQPDSETP